MALREKESGLVHIESPSPAYYFQTDCGSMLDPVLLDVFKGEQGLTHDAGVAPTCLRCIHCERVRASWRR